MTSNDRRALEQLEKDGDAMEAVGVAIGRAAAAFNAGHAGYTRINAAIDAALPAFIDRADALGVRLEETRRVFAALVCRYSIDR